MKKTTQSKAKTQTLTLKQAGTRSATIRKLYHQLEEKNHGSRWSTQEDMVGFLFDVGELGRLLMAAEGRWVVKGEARPQLEAKLAECLWWLFVLSDRLGVDLNQAFLAKMKELETSLSLSVAKTKKLTRKKTK